MALTKKQRLIVWEKSQGKCWYCGCDLPEKGWHADHFEPVRRFKDFKIVDGKTEHFNNMDHPHLDTIDNMVPACSKCNLFKGVFDVEEFRKQLSYQVERARSYSVNFRTAERFGMIEIINKPIVFWFEIRMSDIDKY